jgi:predicted dehydrogenase
MNITPYILGSGNAATAIIEALRVIEINHPEMKLQNIIRLKRNSPFPDVSEVEFPVLFIANPHALHAKAILEGEEKGFKLIVVEKPAAVSLQQIELLKMVKIPVAVCHGYRMMWGIQTLKSMVTSGEFGELISIEGRYWQSSTAEKAVSGKKSDSWKNDPVLSGGADVTFDLAPHWVDAAMFLGGNIKDLSIWKSYKNAETSHRDSHVHVQMKFENQARGLASISKTAHGSANHFEINLIGTKKSATWKFQNADVLEISEGANSSIISKKNKDSGSLHSPHHGLGWLSGYVETIFQALQRGTYPTLQENLEVLKFLVAK